MSTADRKHLPPECESRIREVVNTRENSNSTSRAISTFSFSLNGDIRFTITLHKRAVYMFSAAVGLAVATVYNYPVAVELFHSMLKHG